MNVKKSEQAPQTLSQLCEGQADAFQNFLREKNAFLIKLDEEANQRVQNVLTEHLAWAA